MPKMESGLFQALEAALKVAKEPKTCNELFDLPDVRKESESSNRVSDYLGAMWRKGLITRLPAAKNEGSAARWAYVWKTNVRTKRAMPTSAELEDIAPSAVLLNRPEIQILNEGNAIKITMPSMTLTIELK